MWYHTFTLTSLISLEELDLVNEESNPFIKWLLIAILSAIILIAALVLLIRASYHDAICRVPYLHRYSIYREIKAKIRKFFIVLPWVIIPFLLFLPLYYFGIAGAVAAAYQAHLPSINPTTSHATELPPSQEEIHVQPSSSQIPSLSRLTGLQISWNLYVQARMHKWTICFGITGTLLSAILGLFQIPSANEDPVVHDLAFLTVLNSTASLIYTLVFRLYFESCKLSPQFAMVWMQQATEPQSRLWIMLSLPAYATVWTVISFIFSMLFQWRDSSPTGPADGTPPKPSTTMALNILMTILTGLYLCAGLWAGWLMRRLSLEVLHMALDRV
ncbi:hypothetical protein H0H81_001074 [Sphagnurus paluster]|uniref:Uncharacterized protein n=1 Tax=Sphagnurus paluster TaxID=117069 RepID=A0A9P7GME6_9AGAR|nr:hypothetical protein H0H81_001074 [Sphagnurus paluster]